MKTPSIIRGYLNDVCKFECSSEHDAFMYLLRVQPRSVLSAITEDGWRVVADYETEVVEWNEKYHGI